MSTERQRTDADGEKAVWVKPVLQELEMTSTAGGSNAGADMMGMMGAMTS